MSLISNINRAVFKRTSTFALAVTVGAFFFERAFELSCYAIYENINRGKLWDHIKDKYDP